MRGSHLTMLCGKCQRKNRSKNDKSSKRKKIFSKNLRENFLSKADLNEIHVLKSIWFPWLPKRQSMHKLRETISGMKSQVASKVGQLDIVRRSSQLSESCAQRTLYRRELELDRKLNRMSVYQSGNVPQCQRRETDVNFPKTGSQTSYKPYQEEPSEMENDWDDPVRIENSLNKTDLTNISSQQNKSFLMWRAPIIDTGLQNMKRCDRGEKIPIKEKSFTIPDWFLRACACGFCLELQSSYPDDFFRSCDEFRNLADLPRALYIKTLDINNAKRACTTDTHFIVIEKQIFPHGLRPELCESPTLLRQGIENANNLDTSNHDKTKRHLKKKYKGYMIPDHANNESNKYTTLEREGEDRFVSLDPTENPNKMRLKCHDNLDPEVNEKLGGENDSKIRNVHEILPREETKESPWKRRCYMEDGTNSGVLLEPLHKTINKTETYPKKISHRRVLKKKRPLSEIQESASINNHHDTITNSGNNPRYMQRTVIPKNLSDTETFKECERSNPIQLISFPRKLLKVNDIFQRLRNLIVTSSPKFSERHKECKHMLKALGIASTKERAPASERFISKLNNASSISSSAQADTYIRPLSSCICKNINNSSMTQSCLVTSYPVSHSVPNTDDLIPSNNQNTVDDNQYLRPDLVSEMFRESHSNSSISYYYNWRHKPDWRQFVQLPMVRRIRQGIHEFVRDEWLKACKTGNSKEQSPFTSSQWNNDIKDTTIKSTNDCTAQFQKSADDMSQPRESYCQTSVPSYYSREEFDRPSKRTPEDTDSENVENTGIIPARPHLSFPVTAEEVSALSHDTRYGLMSNSEFCDENCTYVEGQLSNDSKFWNFPLDSHAAQLAIGESRILNIESERSKDCSHVPSNGNNTVGTIYSQTPGSSFEININSSSKPSMNSKLPSKKITNNNLSKISTKPKTQRKQPWNAKHSPLLTRMTRKANLTNTSTISTSDVKHSSNMNPTTSDSQKYSNAVHSQNTSATEFPASEDRETSRNPSTSSAHYNHRDRLNVYDFNKFQRKERPYPINDQKERQTHPINNDCSSSRLYGDKHQKLGLGSPLLDSFTACDAYNSTKPPLRNEPDNGTDGHQSNHNNDTDRERASFTTLPKNRNVSFYERKQRYNSDKYCPDLYENSYDFKLPSTEATSSDSSVNQLRYKNSLHLLRNQSSISNTRSNEERSKMFIRSPVTQSQRKGVDFVHRGIIKDQSFPRRNLSPCPSSDGNSLWGKRSRNPILPRTQTHSVCLGTSPPNISQYCSPIRKDCRNCGTQESRSYISSSPAAKTSISNLRKEGDANLQFSTSEGMMKFQLQFLSYINQILNTSLTRTTDKKYDETNGETSRKTLESDAVGSPSQRSSPQPTDNYSPGTSALRTFRDREAFLERSRSRRGRMTSNTSTKKDIFQPRGKYRRRPVNSLSISEGEKSSTFKRKAVVGMCDQTSPYASSGNSYSRSYSKVPRMSSSSGPEKCKEGPLGSGSKVPARTSRYNSLSPRQVDDPKYGRSSPYLQGVNMKRRNALTTQTLPFSVRYKEKVLVNKKCQVGRSKVATTTRTHIHSTFQDNETTPPDAVERGNCQSKYAWTTQLDEWRQCPKSEIFEICTDPQPEEAADKSQIDPCKSESFSIKEQRTRRCSELSNGLCQSHISSQSDSCKSASTLEIMDIDSIQDNENEEYATNTDDAHHKSPIIHIRYRARKKAGSDNNEQSISHEEQRYFVERQLDKKLSQVIQRSLELQKEILKIKENPLDKTEEVKEKDATSHNNTYNDDTQTMAFSSNMNSNAKCPRLLQNSMVNDFPLTPTSAEQNEEVNQIPAQSENNLIKENTNKRMIKNSHNISNSLYYPQNESYYDDEQCPKGQSVPTKFFKKYQENRVQRDKSNMFSNKDGGECPNVIHHTQLSECNTSEVIYPSYKQKYPPRLSISQKDIQDGSSCQHNLLPDTPNTRQHIATTEEVWKEMKHGDMASYEVGKKIKSKSRSSDSCSSIVTKHKCSDNVRHRRKCDHSRKSFSPGTITIDIKPQEVLKPCISAGNKSAFTYQKLSGDYWQGQWDINCVGSAHTHLSRSTNQHHSNSDKDRWIVRDHCCSGFNAPILSGQFESKSSATHCLGDGLSRLSELQNHALQSPFAMSHYDKLASSSIVDTAEKEQEDMAIYPEPSKQNPLSTRPSTFVEAWSQNKKDMSLHSKPVPADNINFTDETRVSIMMEGMHSSGLSDSKSSTHGFEDIPLDTDSESRGGGKMRHIPYSERESCQFIDTECKDDKKCIDRRLNYGNPLPLQKPFLAEKFTCRFEQSFLKVPPDKMSNVTTRPFPVKGDSRWCKEREKRILQKGQSQHHVDRNIPTVRKTADSRNVQDTVTSLKETYSDGNYDKIGSTESIVITSSELESSEGSDTETQFIHTPNLMDEEKRSKDISHLLTKETQPRSEDSFTGDDDKQKDGSSNSIIHWWNCPNVNEASVHEKISSNRTDDSIFRGKSLDKQLTSGARISENHPNDDLILAREMADNLYHSDEGDTMGDGEAIQAHIDIRELISTNDCKSMSLVATAADLVTCSENHETLSDTKVKQQLAKTETYLNISPRFDSFSGGVHSESSGNSNLSQKNAPLVGIGYLVEAEDDKVILEGAFVGSPGSNHQSDTVPSLSRQGESRVINFRVVITLEGTPCAHSESEKERQALHGTYRRQIETVPGKFFTWRFSTSIHCDDLRGGKIASPSDTENTAKMQPCS